jgi:hypothetical protein
MALYFRVGGCKEVDAVFKIKKKKNSKSDHGSKQSAESYFVIWKF